MNERNFFLDPRTGSNLLLKAAGEKVKNLEVPVKTLKILHVIKSWLLKNYFSFMADGRVHSCKYDMGSDASSEYSTNTSCC